MKRTIISGLLVVLAVASLFAGDDKKATVLFQAAQARETIQGDLKGAIALYQDVVKEAGGNRAIAARALVRMAECYQKLGDAESRKIYERIMREFADQKEEVTLARARLGGTETVGRAKGDRPVWTGGFVDGFGTISPEGRYLTYTDWGAGAGLMLHDMVTGTNRRLTGPGGQGATQFSAISRDGKQVAYEWRNEQRRYELRTSSLEGTGIPESRRLLDLEDAEEVAPFDWSPDGKWIAVGIFRKDLTRQIGLVSVSDGAVRVLKSLDWKGPSKIFFSPDGRYVAYDLLAADNTNDRHVFVMAVDGSRETRVVEHASQNIVMGWSPDGTYVLFASDRSGSIGLWIVRMSDGKPQGTATLVKPDIGTMWSNGLTASGTMYVWKEASPTYIQVAPIDLTAGKLVPTTSPIFQRFIGSRGRPDWSADGKFLAYSSCGGLGGGPCTLFIRSTETGHVRELRPPLAYFAFPHWSPTGRALMLPGTDLKGRQALFSIDVQTGDMSVLLTRDDVDRGNRGILRVLEFHWAPDGKSVCYRSRDERLISRDLTSGKETEIGRASSDWTVFAISPDGRSVAAITNDASGNTTVLVGPLQGERRAVLRLTPPASIVLIQDFAWTLDGRALIVVKQPTRDRDHNELWLVPVDGAAPRRLDINTDSWQLGNGFRLSPDGRQIAFVASAGKRGQEIWALENFLPAPKASR